MLNNLYPLCKSVARKFWRCEMAFIKNVMVTFLFFEVRGLWVGALEEFVVLRFWAMAFCH